VQKIPLHPPQAVISDNERQEKSSKKKFGHFWIERFKMAGIPRKKKFTLHKRRDEKKNYFWFFVISNEEND
jgi:hypothetical protein